MRLVRLRNRRMLRYQSWGAEFQAARVAEIGTPRPMGISGVKEMRCYAPDWAASSHHCAFVVVTFQFWGMYKCQATVRDMTGCSCVGSHVCF